MPGTADYLQHHLRVSITSREGKCVLEFEHSWETGMGTAWARP